MRQFQSYILELFLKRADSCLSSCVRDDTLSAFSYFNKSTEVTSEQPVCRVFRSVVNLSVALGIAHRNEVGSDRNLLDQRNGIMAYSSELRRDER